jgi:hypothetical protein
MKTELLTWHNADETKPDPDISVLCCRSNDFFIGYWDDEIEYWVSNEDNERINGVLYWAEPLGPN